MWSNSYFTSTTVKDVLHTFQYGPFVPLEEDDSTTLLDAALILGKYVSLALSTCAGFVMPLLSYDPGVVVCAGPPGMDSIVSSLCSPPLVTAPRRS